MTIELTPELERRIAARKAEYQRRKGRKTPMRYAALTCKKCHSTKGPFANGLHVGCPGLQLRSR